MSQMKTITFANDQTGESWTYDVAGNGGGEACDLLIETSESLTWYYIPGSEFTVDKEQIVSAVTKAIGGEKPNVILKAITNFGSGSPYTAYLTPIFTKYMLDEWNGEERYYLSAAFDIPYIYGGTYNDGSQILHLTISYDKNVDGNGNESVRIDVTNAPCKEEYDLTITFNENLGNPNSTVSDIEEPYASDVKRVINMARGYSKPKILLRGYIDLDSGPLYDVRLEPIDVASRIYTASTGGTVYVLYLTFAQRNYFDSKFTSFTISFELHEDANENQTAFYMYFNRLSSV